MEVLAKNLRRHLLAYPLPILRLARLAVDEHFQGHAMPELALEMQVRVGCIVIVVGAKTDAINFYSALGFKSIELLSGALGDRPEPVAMFFLPIGQIAAAANPTLHELE